MKIAQLSTCWNRTAPGVAGDVEEGVSRLTEQLVAVGHEVTLFATGDSSTRAKLWSYHERPVARAGMADEVLHVARAYEYIAAEGFDVIHNHNGGLGLVSLFLSDTPCVTTVHTPRDPLMSMLQQMLSARHRYLSVSRRQRDASPQLNWVETLPRPFELGDHPYVEEKEPYLLLVADPRAAEDARAIVEACEAQGRPLKVVEPAAAPADLQEQYAHARAVIFASPGEEPAPLLPLKILASGTPLIAPRGGEYAEFIAGGEVGFTFGDRRELEEAVRRVDAIPAAACRRHVETHYDARDIAARHLAVYERVLASGARP